MPNDLISLDQMYTGAEVTPTASFTPAPPAPKKTGVIPLSELYGEPPAAPPSAGAGRGRQGGPGFGEESSYRTKQKVLPLAYDVAALGDMILGIPGGAAGSIGELGMRVAGPMGGMDAVSHRNQAAAGRDFREHVSQVSSPQLFHSIVQKLAGDEDPQPSHVERAMGKLQEWIDKGGKIVDTTTGGLITKDDVSALANGAMNALGVGALRAVPKGRFNPEIKMPGKGEVPKPEGAPPVPEPDKPFEATENPLRTATRPDVMSEKKLGKTQAAFKQFMDARTERAAEQVHTQAQAGGAKPELLAGIALGSTGIALARAYPDKQDDLLGGVMALGMIGPKHLVGLDAAPLGAILRDGQNSLLTLERLPQNRTEFSKAMVREQLQRPDVTKAEKEVLTDVLTRWGDKEKITALDLVKGLKSATQDFNLVPKETEQYANYGLENIDRLTSDDPAVYYNGTEMSELSGPPAKTTVWQLPEHMEMSDANHFQDPRYFGHTRSFEEGGVKHVVEVQSDLAQKAGKELTEGERADLVEESKRLQREWDHAYNDLSLRGLDRYPDAVRKKLEEISLRQEEVKVKLNAGAISSQLSPMLKHWERRLVREELADSARQGKETVRFATADTVAKVEGWPDERARIEARISDLERSIASRELKGDPGWRAEYNRRDQADVDTLKKSLEEGRRFTKEHQSIYDRHNREVVKFLKNLGGKEVTDSAGHTWIETPTGIKSSDPVGSMVAKRAKMFGGVSLEQLKNLAYISLGATIGAKLDPEDPIVGAFLGGTFGAMGVRGAARGVGSAFSALTKADTRIRINNITEDHAYRLGAAERETYQVGEQIIALVPDKDTRQAIHRAIDQGKTATLTGNAAKAAKIAQDFYAKVAEEAGKLGVLDEARENYSTHLWSDKAKAKDFLSAKRAQSMSPNSRFNKQRVFMTMEEGKAAGLKPLTEDIAEVLGVYGNSMARTMANRVLLNRLRNSRGPGGERLVSPASRAPGDYETIDSPFLRDVRVHPDIAPSLKFMYEAQEPGAIMGALEAVNTALKRNAVSFSLFHAKALADAFIGAVNNPLTVGKTVGQAILPRVFGRNRYLEQLRKGGSGDLVDSALRDGLKFSYERAEPNVDDASGNFYSSMRTMQRWADEKLPFNLGKNVVGTYVRVNHAFDNFMWGRLHAAMKLEVYAAKKEALLVNTAKAGKAIPEREAGRIAAEYANDIFGGLNWQRLAEGAKTKWGRDFALSIASKSGRRVAQLLTFAPDWTLSTSRAFFKAFQKGSGVKGLFDAKTSADLYRQQLARSALYYVLVGDAINYYNSGHHLWENDSKIGPFFVDLGDGRKMQLSKHFTEPFHWMTDPGQQALNKLGVLPKEAATQLLGKEYLSTKAMPPMDTSPGGRAKHLAKNALPIGATQFQNGTSSGLAGAAGFPIYGQTAEQRKAERERQYRLSIERYKKAHGIQ